MYKPDIVYYHYPCSDGLTAAAIVSDYYKDESIEFKRLDYGNLLPTIDYINECRDKKILMVDVSFKKDILEKIAQSAENIIIIDHHAGVLDDLQEYNVGTYVSISNFEKMITSEHKIGLIYDGGHSGAGLTWSIFNEDLEPSEFIEYIEHVDLGRSSFPNTAQFRSWSRSIPFDIATMITYLPKNNLHEAFSGGKAIDNFVQTRISTLLEQTRLLEINDYEPIPYVISDYAFASDAANALVQQGHNLAIVFYFTKSGMGASIRSTEAVDAAEFAKSFGGNGHRRAAGFNISWANLPDFLEAFEESGNAIFGNLFLQED